jgi:hypothetical protein
VERDYSNNWAQACFTLSYSGNIPEVIFNHDQCQPYTDCLGEIFGDVQPDCNGVCAGPALQGDWNQDTVRNDQDIQEYLMAANNHTGDPSNCLDLDGNGAISLYDAALLQQCALHQHEPQYWIQAFPCQFPTGFTNPLDMVTLKPGILDTVAKTFDIEMANPVNKVLGYEFTVSGLTISSIENLAVGYNPELKFNASTGKIIGLALDESVLEKNAIPTGFLRIHYATLTSTEICLASITDVVNSKYQRSHATIANPNCISIKTSSVSHAPKAPFGVYVQPNPFVENTTIYFENDAGAAIQVDLKDITGKILRSFEGIRGTSVTIERGNLPAGAYLFTVRGNRGSVSGKIVAW